MVNEINKPPHQPNENLEERGLAATNEIHQMQEQHRNLLEEIESLRQRAAQLSRSNDLNAVSRNEVDEPSSENAASSVEATNDVGDIASPSDTAIPSASDPPTENECEDEDPESAAFLNEKFAEIAALKAKYKRVQELISMNNRIEQFIGSKSEVEVNTVTGNSEAAAKEVKPSAETVAAAVSTASTVSTASEEQVTSDVQTANEELLSTMVNMLHGFTTDLRDEAISLRAERERINNLKMEIMRQRKQQ